MRRVEIGKVSEAVVTVDFLYETGPDGPYKPAVRNVELDNVTSTASPRVMWIVSFPNALIDDIRFIDCTFRGLTASDVMEYAGSVSFRNVTLEPANRGRSRNSRATPPR